MNDNRGLASWLQLALTPGLGSSAIRALLGRFGLPENIQAAPVSEVAKIVGADVAAGIRANRSSPAVDAALQWAGQRGHAVLTLADTGYPRQLLEIPDPPTLLYAVGRLELLSQPALAIVGSRNATVQGARNAEQFARALGAAGLTIVSGLALGIDAAAHRGALGAPGSTIAVLGTGIDIVYPRQHASLAAEIAEGGLLLSEFPLGAAAAAHHFPRRNRLISGLARGCLVVEAALASGSLITARAAADQGRDVFAIPGSIHSPLSKGCHALIKQGAKLVESAEDVLAELTGYHRTAAATTQDLPPEEDDPLLTHMGDDPVDVDSLCSRTGLPAERINADLLRLELDGRVAALPGGIYQRLK